uniref:Uncharacterized protein n=1 Tax=Anguilla anguilla TaxID=7936 RepID=A0A0E9WA90_ANGAN
MWLLYVKKLYVFFPCIGGIGKSGLTCVLKRFYQFYTGSRCVHDLCVLGRCYVVLPSRLAIIHQNHRHLKFGVIHLETFLDNTGCA